MNCKTYDRTCPASQGVVCIRDGEHPTKGANMNSTQLTTTSAALVATAAGYAAGHGWLGLDAGAWGLIFGSLALIVPILAPALLTRAKALKNTVGNMDHTTVVTDAASAAALPNNKDVVAATPAIVAAIKAVQ